MKFIFDPDTDGSWLAVQDGIDKDELSYRLKNADLVISDLDDTDAPSPARAIAFGNPIWRYMTDRKLRNWYLRAAKAWVMEGSAAESKVWKEYVELFLRDPKELERVRENCTPEFAALTFYPGVIGFYNDVIRDGTIGVYLSRNIEPVVESYRKAAGFTLGLFEQYDKEKSISDALELFCAGRRNVIVKGDSREDEVMVDVLESRRRSGMIESVTSIFVSPRPEILNPNFDVNIGRNYNGLVRLLTEH